MKLAFGVSYEEYWRIIPFAYERCYGKGWSNLLANIYGLIFVGVYGIMVEGKVSIAYCNTIVASSLNPLSQKCQSGTARSCCAKFFFTFKV